MAKESKLKMVTEGEESAIETTAVHEEHLEEDLGLGEKVAQENRTRFVNPDGSFNVHRKGIFDRGSFSPYHAILNMSWSRFYGWVLTVFAAVNVVFTALYVAAGRSAFPTLVTLGFWERAEQIFLYSIQIATTLGASPLHPVTNIGQIVLTVETVMGAILFTLAAGIIFARFSNPAVKIVFSTRAVVAPHKGGTAFMFRVINGRSNELVQLSATLIMVMALEDGKRKFQQLPLERPSVQVFPLSWTVVHSINKKSPLWGLTAEDLARSRTEFLVNLTAVDKDLSKTVYANYSYLHNEVLFGARFHDIIEHTDEGTVVVDPKRIHEIDLAA